MTPPDAPSRAAPPLRVVQVVPSLAIGGAERMATWLAEAQLEAGHDVSLLCLRASGPLHARLSAALRARTTVLGGLRRLDPRLLRRLRAHLRQRAPDVVHLHMFTALSWGGLAARTAGVPRVVYTEHGLFGPEPLPFATARRVGLATADAVVACSRPVLDHLERGRYASARRRHHIDNGIPLACRPRAPLTGEPLRVGCVGRLAPVKGHQHIVEAMRRLRERGARAELVLMGGGERMDALRAQAAHAGVPIHFTGPVDDVPERLATLDLFAQPSLSEGLPMALLEAAAAGLPLLVTDVGGAPGLIEAGAGGFVVPPADPSALADTIARVAAMPPAERRRLGDASRDTVVAHYDLSTMAARYEALYRELLRRPR